MFHGYYRSRIFVKTLINNGKLSISKLFTFIILALKAKIISLLSYKSHPVLDRILVSMVEGPGLHHLVVMGQREAKDTVS